MSVVVIGNTFTCGFSRNVPLLHMSTQHLDTSLPSLALVLQMTNAGVKRPWYKANTSNNDVITSVLPEICLRGVHDEIHNIKKPLKPCLLKYFKWLLSHRRQRLAKGSFYFQTSTQRTH